MKKLTPWHAAYAVDMAVACGISYTIITQILVPFVDRSDVLLGGMWAVVATTFVFRESRESTPVRRTGAPDRDVRQLRSVPCLSLDFSVHGVGHGGRDRPRHDRNDTFGSTGGHCHDGDYDHSCLGSRSAEHAAGLAPTDSSSRRYPGRDRGWSFVQVACLVRFLSDDRRTRPMTDTAMPSANSCCGIRLLPGVLSLVSAMAVQNALVQVSLHGVPATAVITTNIAR